MNDFFSTCLTGGIWYVIISRVLCFKPDCLIYKCIFHRLIRHEGSQICTGDGFIAVKECFVAAIKVLSGWGTIPQSVRTDNRSLQGAAGNPPSSEGMIGQGNKRNHIHNQKTEGLPQKLNYPTGYPLI